MFRVLAAPREMNETVARAFNGRSLDTMLSLYEPDAAPLTGRSRSTTIFRIGSPV